jgi:hypothetical protein
VYEMCRLGFCSLLGLFCAVSSLPHDFVFTASDDLLTCSENVAVKVSFVFVVWVSRWLDNSPTRCWTQPILNQKKRELGLYHWHKLWVLPTTGV